MVCNIAVVSENDDRQKMYFNVGAPIHDSLIGNPDYVKSNIVLHIDDVENKPSCNLIVFTNKCQDKEYLREKLKNAIDIFLDSAL